jgi:MFS family permease
VGPAIVIGAATGIAVLLVPLAPESGPIPYLVVAQAIMSFGVVLYNVTQGSFRQAITPERLQGRMNSVMRFMVWGVMPLGMLVGGTVASVFDLRAAMWVGAIGMSLAFLPVLLSPVRTLREMPEQVADPLAEAQGEGGRVLPGQMPAVEDLS